MAARQRIPLPAIAFLILLLLGLGVGGWLVSQDKQPRVNSLDVAEQDNTPANEPPQSNAAPESEPEPEPEPEPVPEPVEGRTHVAMPQLTRFRALVLEADAALAVSEPPAAKSDEAWLFCSTLEQLKSRFAPHARLVYEGLAQPSDITSFSAEVSAAFLRPDVARGSYTIKEGSRAALWSREGVRLPDAEHISPPGVYAPITRRLQESVDVASVGNWLSAIESEFGKTDYTEALPLDFVIFRDDAEYLNFSRKRLRLDVPGWSAGLFSSSWEVVCIPVLDSTCLAEVIRHEMFHAVQSRLAPESLLVPWFAEGTAEWLDKAAPLSGAVRTHPEFATAAWGYLGVLIERGYEVKLRELLEMELADFYANPELHYLLAYCWVDFARSEEDLLPHYRQFWELMKQGVSRQQAFARTFGTLNFDELTQRFLARARRAPRNTMPPRFSHDAPEAAFGNLPGKLGGTPEPPAKEGEVASGWYATLAELERRGIDTARAAYFKGDFDLVVVAIDSSETMAGKIEEEWFDWEGYSRWLFSLRYAGTLAFNRKGSDGTEEVPPEVLMAMVEAVLTDKTADFVEATGVKVPDQIVSDVKDNYKRFDLQPARLKVLPRRELSLHTAESITWFWGTRQDRAKVVVVDFNTKVQTEKEESAFKADGFKSSASPIQKLFAKTKANAAPFGADGTDCDWWQGLTGITETARGESGTRVACLFFTDGLNSSGAYGHAAAGVSMENYLRDQEAMADAYFLMWQEASLDNANSVLQLVALPGAENKGLQFVRQKVTQAKLDTWSERFRK